MHTYSRIPIEFTHGEGMYLYDTKGNKYLDAFGGIAVCVLGHVHPVVTAAIQKQAAKLIHTSNLYEIENQTLLANKICKATGLDQVFFSNSGAEAVECALKLARLNAHQKGIEHPKIIAMKKSFHGRTLATISAGGNHKIQAGFEPLMPGFIHIPFNDIPALQETAKQHGDVAAVIVEPIQGEGGINVPHQDYLTHVREICDRNAWLLILDEVQTGMGRTGTLFNYQSKGFLPDILTVAKGLANGVPIGATIAKKECSIFKPGNHGSTFGGNPLACAAGLATLTEIERLRLWENAEKMGDKLIKGLKTKLKGHPHVVDIRGQGLMIGIELDRPCRNILNLALREHLLFNITSEKVIRLLPALIIEEEQVDFIVKILPELITEFTSESDIPAQLETRI